MSTFSRALLAILPAWRSLCDHSLPLWTFIARRRLTPSRNQVMRAEMRCAVCDLQPECRALIARGRCKPGYRCPNAQLLRR